MLPQLTRGRGTEHSDCRVKGVEVRKSLSFFWYDVEQRQSQGSCNSRESPLVFLAWVQSYDAGGVREERPMCRTPCERYSRDEVSRHLSAMCNSFFRASISRNEVEEKAGLLCLRGNHAASSFHMGLRGYWSNLDIQDTRPRLLSSRTRYS